MTHDNDTTHYQKKYAIIHRVSALFLFLVVIIVGPQSYELLYWVDADIPPRIASKQLVRRAHFYF